MDVSLKDDRIVIGHERMNSMKKITQIEGIGEADQAKLNDLGIVSVEQLLDACKTKKERKELADKAEISEDLILTWANHADLFRIKGIAGQYSELLEAAGVDTVKELAQRNPENLTEAMEKINEEKNLVRSVPYLKMVKKWVDQAKDLPRIVEY